MDRKQFTYKERKQIGEWLRNARAEGMVERDDVLLTALNLASAELEEDLALVYQYIVVLDKEHLVDLDHPAYEQLVHGGYIEEDDTCTTCAGTGIGQSGDPDTSRCSPCGGSGDSKRRRIRNMYQ